MDPFEPGMVGAPGLHAIMSRQAASRGQRQVQGESRTFFYNPMWSFLGDLSAGPPGTYYRAPSEQLSYFWHMFDQVLVRPELLDRFDGKDVTVLTTAGDLSLLNSNHIPDSRQGSDHLPLLFRMNLYEGGEQ